MPPGCASTRPWAAGYNAFGVKGPQGARNAPRVREYATLGWGMFGVSHAPRRPKQRCRLGVRMLEQRAVPSTIDWIGGAHSAFNVTTGDPAAWSNPFNWIGQVAPGPNDTAVFDANTSISFSDGLGDTQTFTATTSSTVDLSFPTIGGVSLDSNWPGTLTVNASLGL